MVSEANVEYQSAELEELIKKIAEAIKQDKWMIHYSVSFFQYIQVREEAIVQ